MEQVFLRFITFEYLSLRTFITNFRKNILDFPYRPAYTVNRIGLCAINCIRCHNPNHASILLAHFSDEEAQPAVLLSIH